MQYVFKEANDWNAIKVTLLHVRRSWWYKLPMQYSAKELEYIEILDRAILELDNMVYDYSYVMTNLSYFDAMEIKVQINDLLNNKLQQIIVFGNLSY